MIRVAVDTGGTFTDCLAVADGELRRAKVLSTGSLRGRIRRVDGAALLVEWSFRAVDQFFDGAHLRSLGSQAEARIARSWADGRLTLAEPRGDFVAGEAVQFDTGQEAPLVAARLALGVPLARALPPVEFRLATTRGTNALLERRGARLVFFVTAGFADLLEIGHQQRPDLFALAPRKPRPLPARVCEVAERRAADGAVLRALDEAALRTAARSLREQGFDCAAVALLHADRFPEAERRVAEVLRSEGFRWLSLSSAVAPFQRIVPRAQTTVVDAYLRPLLAEYLAAVAAGLDERSSLRVMTSAGGLVAAAEFRGADSLVSGPAGGVLGALSAGRAAGFERILGFDMGGTSTDVCRADGRPTYRFSSRVGEAEILAPSIALETVAAGGGSLLRLDGARLLVGPESAGASPGPASYGAGGPLALTDANLLLGRLPADRFALPLRLDAARGAAEALALEAGAAMEDLLLDAISIAEERTADALREVSVREGHDPAEHALVAFGGAAGQHACAVADLLGIPVVIAPADSSLLSARGLLEARRERFAERQILAPLDEVASGLAELWRDLETEARRALAAEAAEIEFEPARRILRVRLRGHEAAVDLEDVEDGGGAERAFVRAYRSLFGDLPPDRLREVESARVVVAERIAGPVFEQDARPAGGPRGTEAAARFRVRVARGWISVPGFERSAVAVGAVRSGPALIVEPYTSVWVPEGWSFEKHPSGAILLRSAG